MPKRRVANLGVSGYSPGQYLLRARRLLPAIDPDIIVVVFFAQNDVPFLRLSTFFKTPKPVIGPDFEPVNTPLEDISGNTARRFRSLSILNYAGALLHAAFPETAPPPVGYDFDQLDYERAMELVARIGVEHPDARLIVAYMPFDFETVHPTMGAKSRRQFVANCQRLALECHVPAFADAPATEIATYYIPGDGHLTLAASSDYAAFLAAAIDAR